MALVSVGIGLAMASLPAPTSQVTGNHAAFCEEDKKIAFSPKEFRSFTIRGIKQLSPNTKAYNIALPSSDSTMGMGVAAFVMVRHTIVSQ